MPSRLQWSAAERKLRSRIAQLASQTCFLRGTLHPRRGKCGKPSCRCAQGQLHSSLYLVQRHQGKLRQICVPQAWHPRVRQAVHNYQQMQQFMEQVSQLEWKRLEERKR